LAASAGVHDSDRRGRKRKLALGRKHDDYDHDGPFLVNRAIHHQHVRRIYDHDNADERRICRYEQLRIGEPAEKLNRRNRKRNRETSQVAVSHADVVVASSAREKGKAVERR
jgi:hypothetical protein